MSDLELPSINEFLQNSQGRTPESQIRSILQGVSGLDPTLLAGSLVAPCHSVAQQQRHRPAPSPRTIVTGCEIS